jgi:hypothetical protein
MDFMLHTADERKQFDGDSTYHFNQYGLLVIESNGRKVTFSPSEWNFIDEAATRPEDMVL